MDFSPPLSSLAGLNAPATLVAAPSADFQVKLRGIDGTAQERRRNPGKVLQPWAIDYSRRPSRASRGKKPGQEQTWTDVSSASLSWVPAPRPRRPPRELTLWGRAKERKVGPKAP